MGFLGRLFGFGKKGAAGVDIGSSSIKISYLEETKKGLVLSKLGFINTPKGALRDGRILDASALSESIKQLYDSLNCPTRKVISAVGGQTVLVRPIVLPQMSEKDLNKTLQYEAERYLPYSISDAQIACQIIQKSIPGNEKNMEVLLVSAQKELIQNVVEALEMAGLEAVAMDLEPFALLRSLQLSVPIEKFKQTLCVINLGASYSSINIIKNGILRHSRNISTGGDSFTKTIAQSMNLTFEEAEKLKVEKGIIRTGEETKPVEPVSMRIFNVVSPLLKEFIVEIQRSFDYYRSRYKGELVEHIIITGGGACFCNIDKFLNNEIGIPVEICNFIDNSGVRIGKDVQFTKERLSELAPEFTICIGLGMREIMLENPAKYQQAGFEVN